MYDASGPSTLLQVIVLAIVCWLAWDLRKVRDQLARMERELLATRGQVPTRQAAPPAVPSASQPAVAPPVPQPVTPPSPLTQTTQIPVPRPAPTAADRQDAALPSQTQQAAYNQPQTQATMRAVGAPPAPAQPVAYQLAPVQTTQPRPRRSVENVLGTNVLGTMAALLVFVGLVLLAILVMPSLTDEVRCAAMFALSLALTGAGAFAIERARTPFSQALLGCGLGATFISVLVAHVYFGFVGELPAMGLLLAWLAFCFLLTQRYQSAVLSVIAQVGMAISVCLAYQGGFDDARIPFVISYQLAACAIVVFGTTRCLEQQRMMGLFSSLAISLVASAFIVGQSPTDETGVLSAAALAGSCAIQLVGATALAALITRVAQADPESTPGRAIARHTAAKAFWLVSVLLNAYLGIAIAHHLHTDSLGISPSFLFGARVSLACVAAHWVASLLLFNRNRLSAAFAKRSVACMAAGSVVFLTLRALPVVGADVISLAVLPGIGLWASGVVLRDERPRLWSVAFLAIDALLMVAFGYGVLDGHFGWVASLAYLAGLVALLCIWWATLPEDARHKTGGGTLLVGLVGLELSIGPALASLEPGIQGLSSCIAVLAALVAVAATRLDEKVVPGTGILLALQVNDLLVILASCVTIAGNGPAHAPSTMPSAFLAMVVVALTLALIVRRASLLPTGDASWQQVAYGICLTALSAATVEGFAGDAGSYYVTLTCMVVALACIALGFWRTWRHLRLYGLVLTILCVLKLVLVDMGHESSVASVVSFIVGGLICFAVSALYSYAVRRFGEGLEPRDR